MIKLCCLALIFLLLISVNATAVATSLALPQMQTANETLDDTQKLALKAYAKKLDKILRRHWFPPHDGRAPTTEFTIMHDGKLGESKLTQTSGEPRSDQAALEAIEKSSPFPPLPASIGELAITCKFDYSELLSGSPHFKSNRVKK